MNLSSPFVRRPIGTVLLTVGMALAGIAGFFVLPVSPLPQVDYPVISVSASIPGASPETMATSVATPLERRLGTIAGVNEITSSSSTGSARVTLQFDSKEPVPEVIADAAQLQQVVTNLVVNARDAIAGPGQIELSSCNRTLTQADCDSLMEAVPGDYACLSVRDSGSGMPPELVAKIFEPFFTTKPAGQGTGLGLAMVHGVVKQNQGTIHVQSEPGCGTCFQIYLPRA